MIQPKTIIVGGGVIGLSVGWELLRRGERVTLLESDAVGRATSWAAAGILPPARFGITQDPLDQLRGLSAELFPELTEKLIRETGVDPGFRRCGGWYLAETAGERAAMIGMQAYWGEMDIECASVTHDALRQREPGLTAWTKSNPHAAAWWVPGEGQVHSPDLLESLTKACRRRGAEIIEDTTVREVRDAEHGCEVRVGDRWVFADRVVLCGGAWTGAIAPQLRLGTSIVPVRGQIVLLNPPPGSGRHKRLLHSIINIGHRYLVCRDNGCVLVGSVEEEVGFQNETTPEVLDDLREFACSVCPDLQRSTVQDAWSGLRPMTFDGFPMIGGVPNRPNLFVAAGHFRSGIHLSFGTASVLADLMTGRQPPIDLEPFRVGKQQERVG